MSDAKLSETVGKGKKKETAKRPSVRVRARGRVSSLMDQLGELYRSQHEGRDCRWVYAPSHKPELSNVMSRRAQGYVEVTFTELPEATDLMRGLGPDDAVRVGDVILMSIEAELRDIFKQELQEDALEQGKRVERSYYDEISKLEDMGPDGKAHRSTPRGSVDISVKELEFEYEQRTSEQKE